MRIHAPTRWEHADIEIELLDNSDECPPFVIRDADADLEIVCGIAEIAENVKPIYEPSA
jgi:hypothetical protein